jgi:hypothetical protein
MAIEDHQEAIFVWLNFCNSWQKVVFLGLLQKCCK